MRVLILPPPPLDPSPSSSSTWITVNPYDHETTPAFTSWIFSAQYQHYDECIYVILTFMPKHITNFTSSPSSSLKAKIYSRLKCMQHYICVCVYIYHTYNIVIREQHGSTILVHANYAVKLPHSFVESSRRKYASCMTSSIYIAHTFICVLI